MSLIKIDPAKAAAKQREARIVELKKLLVDSDYKVLPDYDKDSEAIKAQRQAWRAEIRTLEAQ
jgi:hypothetical protein